MTKNNLSLPAFSVIAFVFFACLFGYVKNVIDFFELDFKAPYKAEILRGIGLVVGPLGIIEGLFVTFDEERK